MATTEMNPLAAAAATLAGRSPAKVTKRASAPKNTRSVKGQESIGVQAITWEVAAERVKAAVKMGDAAAQKWVSAGDTLWILGIRPSHFEKVTEGDKIVRTPEYHKVVGLVVASYSPKVQTLLGLTTTMSLAGLSEADRGLREQHKEKVAKHVKTILAHLQKHERELAEPGETRAKVTPEASLAKAIRGIVDRIKKMDAEKTKGFDELRVIELLNEAIAELT